MGLFSSIFSVGKNLLRAEIVSRGKREIILFRNGYYEGEILVTSPSMYKISGNADQTPPAKDTLFFYVFFDSGSIQLEDSSLNMEAEITYHLDHSNKVRIDSVIINGTDFAQAWWKGEVFNALLSTISTLDYLTDETDTSLRNVELLVEVIVFLNFIYIFNELSDKYSEQKILSMSNAEFNSFLIEVTALHSDVLEQAREVLKEDSYQQEQENDSYDPPQTARTQGHVPYQPYLSLYFNILELPKVDTDMEKVKIQYRLLSKRYHPDQSGGNEALFRSVQEAYAFLRENFE